MEQQIVPHNKLVESLKNWVQEHNQEQEAPSVLNVLNQLYDKYGFAQFRGQIPEKPKPQAVDKSAEKPLCNSTSNNKPCSVTEVKEKPESATQEISAFRDSVRSFKTDQSAKKIPKRSLSTELRRKIAFFESFLEKDHKSNQHEQERLKPQVNKTAQEKTKESMNEKASNLYGKEEESPDNADRQKAIVNNIYKEAQELGTLNQREEAKVEINDSVVVHINSKPVIKELILKKDIVEELIRIYKGRDTPLNDEELQEIADKKMYKILRRKNLVPKISPSESKFICNLYEPALFKKKPKIAVNYNNKVIQMDTKLHIDCSKNVTNRQLSNESFMNSPSNLLENSYATIALECSAVQDTSSKEFLQSSSLPKPVLVTKKSPASIVPQDTFLNHSEQYLVPRSVGTESLTLEIENQCRVMHEATKAIQVCHTTDQYSEEQLEAERILLLAEMRRTILLERFKEEKPEHQYEDIERLKISISNLEVPLVIKETDYQLWYVVTCTCGSTLLSSELIELHPRGHSLNLEKASVFENVPPGSPITLEVHQVKTPRSQLQQCLLFPKKNFIASRASQVVRYKDLYTEEVVSKEIYRSIFTLSGAVQITADQLIENQKFVFRTVPKDSTLLGSLKLLTEITSDNYCEIA